jgi:uncharacterized protein (TIGR02596 family)
MILRRAFSLVELLVVVSIILLLMALAATAINPTLRASKLTNATQSIVDELGNARQTALSLNLPVEVRIYKLPPDNALSPIRFRGFQTFLLEASGSKPLTAPIVFPEPVVFSDDTAASSLLGLTEETSADAPGNYVSFRFRPNGLCSGIDSSTTSLTLVFADSPALSSGINFATIQIDPVTGRVFTFRP